MDTESVSPLHIVVQDISEVPNHTYVVPEYSRSVIFLVGSGMLTRDVSVTIQLAGTGADATIIGLFALEGTSHVRLTTLQHHTAYGTKSNLLVRTVLRDAASFYYDGGIRVEHEAQRTDAYQRNENILLSEDAFSESKPSLEILANDVRCTHGATISTLDNEQLFYLQSRGIPIPKSEEVLTQGFLSGPIRAILTEVGDPKRKDALWQQITKYLPQMNFLPEE